MRELDELRAEVDAADEAILAALNRRFAASDRIRELKSHAGLPRVDMAREREILAMAAAAVPAAKRDIACAVFEKILGGSRGEIETIARGVCVRDGRVMLCRAKGAGTTYLPGGHIEFGETGAEALEREMKEETGLDVRVGKFLGIVENSFLQHGEKHCEINLVYAMDLTEGGDGEVPSLEDWIGFEWCPVADLASANLLPQEIAKFISA